MPRVVNTAEVAVTDNLLWAYYAPNLTFCSLLSSSPLNLRAELGKNYVEVRE